MAGCEWKNLHEYSSRRLLKDTGILEEAKAVAVDDMHSTSWQRPGCSREKKNSGGGGRGGIWFP